MKHIDFDFAQRIKMTNLLSDQTGVLGKTMPYFRTLQLIRFTEQEDSQIQKRHVDESRINYVAPDAGFGKISVDIEDADCAALVDLLENCPDVTTLDHVWADSLIASLKGVK